MLKKTFKAVTAFSLLVGCYLGYVQVFAVVVRVMTTTRRTAHDRNLSPMTRIRNANPSSSPRQ